MGTNTFSDEVILRLSKCKRWNAEVLDLSRCDLTEIPEEVFDFHWLQRLDLSGNQIKSVSPSINKLINLRDICLKVNLLTVLPPEIGYLPELRALDLRNNYISSIPSELGGLHKLEQMNLFNNRIGALPGTLVNLTNLEEITLFKNPLPFKSGIKYSLPFDILLQSTFMVIGCCLKDYCFWLTDSEELSRLIRLHRIDERAVKLVRELIGTR